MTITPGALSPPRSIYEPPAVPLDEMTTEQEAAYAVATVAGIVTGAAAQKQAIATGVTLAVVPLLRTVNPYNAVELAALGKQIAEIVDIGRQEVARISYASIATQLETYGINLPMEYGEVGGGRTTPLDVAYQRPAGDYRRRKAAGVESIKGLIQQSEEERFQALGGAVVAKGRTDRAMPNRRLEKITSNVWRLEIVG